MCSGANRWSVVLLSLAVLLCAAGTARAQRTQRLLGQGIKHYNVGEFRKAIKVLRRALKASRKSRHTCQIYLYLGLTHSVLGKHGRARRYVSRALIHNPRLRLDPRRFKPSLVRLVNHARRQQRLRRRRGKRPRNPPRAATPARPTPPALVAPRPAPVVRPRVPPAPAAPVRIVPPVVEPRAPRVVKRYQPPRVGPGELIIDADPGCRVHLDGKVVGTAPLVEKVAAGKHLVAVESADGLRSWQAQVSVNPSSLTRVRAMLPAPAAPRLEKDDPATRQRGTQLIWAWITGSLALAAGGAGAGLMVSAAQDHDEYQQTTDAQRFDELDSQVRQKRTGAYISFGVAGGMAVVSLLLYLTRPALPAGRATTTAGARGPAMTFEF